MATKPTGLMPDPFLLGLQMQQGGEFDGPGMDPVGPPPGLPPWAAPQEAMPIWEQPFTSPYSQQFAGRFAPPNFGAPGPEAAPPMPFGIPNQGMPMPPMQMQGNMDPNAVVPSTGLPYDAPPPWLQPGQVEKHPKWNKFARWSQTQEGKDSMLAGAIFGLSFTNPQKALELATRLNEAKAQRVYQAQQNEQQRQAMLERAKMEKEAGKERKLQSRVDTLMQKLATENIDMNDWFAQYAPEGLDSSNIEPAYQELTKRSAQAAEQVKRDKNIKMLRDALYKGTITLASAIKAAKGDQDLINDFQSIEAARKEKQVLRRKLDDALLKQRRAVTAALSPERKQAIKQTENRIGEIDDRLKLIQKYVETDPFEYFIARAATGEMEAPASLDEAVQLLHKEADTLIQQKAELEKEAYGQAGGTGPSPATIPKPGAQAAPSQAPPTGGMSETEKTRRRKLGLPVTE